MECHEMDICTRQWKRSGDLQLYSETTLGGCSKDHSSAGSNSSLSSNTRNLLELLRTAIRIKPTSRTADMMAKVATRKKAGNETFMRVMFVIYKMHISFNDCLVRSCFLLQKKKLNSHQFLTWTPTFTLSFKTPYRKINVPQNKPPVQIKTVIQNGISALSYIDFQHKRTCTPPHCCSGFGCPGSLHRWRTYRSGCRTQSNTRGRLRGMGRSQQVPSTLLCDGSSDTSV